MIRRFVRWALVVALLVLLVVGFVRDPLATDMTGVLRAPSFAHPLGTDELGRDVLARLAHGVPTTLGSAGIALVLSALLGLAAGAATGWGGGRIAVLVRAFVDVLVALPPLIVAMVVSLVAGPGNATVLLALVAVGWLPFARQADSLAAPLQRQQWMLAHRALGASSPWVWRHAVLPALAQPTAALAVVRFPAMVNTVAALGFLGLGPPPPSPEWGAMLADSVNHLGTAPWLLLAPVGALIAVQAVAARLARPDQSSPLRTRDPREARG
ncbi:ABC transporter permease [Saccharopolyspora hirsuta]|uniref:ABC transporter permease n=1 Tax=Saccharopolyspora hirsuta TaxID=1837 RepID=A0A5M7BNB3_SACHI|nr:ABC transporter permease [Saccharopolyspora hirsuta]KAA5830510.1 ABC transporter permease [Saccharopolyspora hirsuta]